MLSWTGSMGQKKKHILHWRDQEETLYLDKYYVFCRNHERTLFFIIIIIYFRFSNFIFSYFLSTKL